MNIIPGPLAKVAAACALLGGPLMTGCQPDETGTIKSDDGSKAAPGEGRFGGRTPEGKAAPGSKVSDAR
jgi:hypothetical protein